MTVPDYQSLMYPVLAEHADGREKSLSTMRESVARKLELSVEDFAEVLPSGRQTRYNNRANWAHVYLKQAGLLKQIRRGVYQITERGQQALREGNGRIDNNFLDQYPEFLEFKARTGKPTLDGGVAQSIVLTAADSEGGDLTPDEMVREGYRRARSGVAAELLDRLRRVSPAFFEQAVVDLLVGMGYGGSHDDAASVIGRTGDGGIDGIIKEDRLGLESIYIQAKRWKEGARLVARKFSSLPARCKVRRPAKECL